MDIKQYFPVGEDNAIEGTLIISNSTMLLNGSAWLDSASSTEVTLRVAQGSLGAGVWQIDGSAILAVSIKVDVQQGPTKK